MYPDVLYGNGTVCVGSICGITYSPWNVCICNSCKTSGDDSDGIGSGTDGNWKCETEIGEPVKNQESANLFGRVQHEMSHVRRINRISRGAYGIAAASVREVVDIGFRLANKH